MIRKLWRRLGVPYTTLVVTAVSCFCSVLLYILLYTFLGPITVKGILTSIIIPAMVVPLISYFSLGLVLKLDLAEEALQESETKFKNLFHMSPLAVAVTEMKTGKIIDANDKLCEISKYHKEEILGETTTGMGFYSEHDRRRFLEAFNESGKVHGMEMGFKGKDGSIVNALMFAKAIQIGSEKYILTVFYDLTEKLRLETQFRKVEKMEAIATLAGGIAHEFNNALVGITGSIELLRMQLPENGGVKKYGETMEASAHRMTNLTEQLLAYARGGKYEEKTICLTDFVEETLSILRPSIDPSVTLETDLTQNLSHIKADLTQMQMVLSAVLYNAAEAVEREGRIRVLTRNEEIKEDVAKNHQGFKPGRYVCLRVEDNGKGMDEETRDKLFEPFFTTKFQGRGLGMAAVYGIVKNHDGWIGVESRLGAGTSIQIYLPAVEGEAEIDETPGFELEKRTGTILIIEDEEMVLDITRAMLETIGYSVLEAKTGREAIDLIKTFDGDIHLAMLDIKLPDMEGGKLYPLIVEARPQMKVIVCSGYAIDGPARQILDSGAQGFIQKPFTLKTLAEKLNEVMA